MNVLNPTRKMITQPSQEIYETYIQRTVRIHNIYKKGYTSDNTITTENFSSVKT